MVGGLRPCKRFFIITDLPNTGSQGTDYRASEMHYPWINLILFVLLFLQIGTGYLGLVNGDEVFSWVLWLHGIGAYALTVLLWWKSDIILHAVRRKNRWTVQRILFAFTTVLLVLTILFGFVWTFGGPRYWLGFSLLSLHIYISIPLMMLMVWHAWKLRFVFKRPESKDRRLFIYSAGLTAAGLALWRGAITAKDRLDLAGAARRFTGSYETGSFTGRFPAVSWIADRPDVTDQDTWRLTIDGAVTQSLEISLADLRDMPQENVTAILDCTGGWYTEQEWSGVSVAHLLQLAGVTSAGASVTFRAVSGYQRRFGLDEASRFLLALDVAGEPIRHGNGAPLRLVAVNERGVEWVKWITHIQVNTTSKWWQLPLPVQ